MIWGHSITIIWLWQFAGRLHNQGRLKTGNGVQATFALSVMDCPETRFSIWNKIRFLRCYFLS